MKILIIFVNCGFGQSSATLKNRTSSFEYKNSPANYKPDRNPVTYDEDLRNYPLSKPHTYININRNEVQAPTRYATAPEGATALCRDQTYSFSQNRRGTCSRYGGVEKWLK